MKTVHHSSDPVSTGLSVLSVSSTDTGIVARDSSIFTEIAVFDSLNVTGMPQWTKTLFTYLSHSS